MRIGAVDEGLSHVNRQGSSRRPRPGCSGVRFASARCAGRLRRPAHPSTLRVPRAQDSRAYARNAKKISQMRRPDSYRRSGSAQAYSGAASPCLLLCAERSVPRFSQQGQTINVRAVNARALAQALVSLRADPCIARLSARFSILCCENPFTLKDTQENAQ